MTQLLGALAPYIAIVIAGATAVRSLMVSRKKEELESLVSRAKEITDREKEYRDGLKIDIENLTAQVSKLQGAQEALKDENHRLEAKLDILREAHGDLQTANRELYISNGKLQADHLVTLQRLEELGVTYERSVTRIKKLEAQVVELGGQPWTES